jgi:NAD+ kinase
VFETIGIIGRRDDDRASESLSTLIAHLARHSRTVLLDAESTTRITNGDLPRLARDDLGAACDLIIVLAGDGTLLGAARALVRHDVPLVGVNLGRLGFLTDISPVEIADRLDEILAGRFTEERRYLLEAKVVTPEGDTETLLALNEVVAHKCNIARLVELETFIDGRLMSRQRCDGMVVATPTGSTAYALSAGGPIIQSDLEAMVLVPIAPHTLTSRPVVVSADCTVEMRVGTPLDDEVQITCDGQLGRGLDIDDRLFIRRHPHALKLIHPTSYDYFSTLRAKLYWGRET